ncbi:hypothetical protein D3C85_1674060 [compost metagenome]
MVVLSITAMSVLRIALVIGRSTSHQLPHPGPGADAIGLQIARIREAADGLAGVPGQLKHNHLRADIHSPSRFNL